MKKRRLIVLLILLGVAAGALAVTYWPTARRRAMARVEALNGTYTEEVDEDGGAHQVNGVTLVIRPVTTQDLAALRDIRPLHRLLLDGSPIHDADLAILGEIQELELLTLTNTPVTDAGLPHLRNLKNLKNLSLRRTQVTDAGLVHLRELTRLQFLNIAETRVTDAGAEELQRALPNTQIYLHHPPD